MKDTKRHDNLEEYRIRAGILIKQLRSDNPDLVAQAAVRFRVLDSLSSRSVDEIRAQRDKLQKKHALTVVALEKGFTSWTELKASFDSAGETSSELLHPRRLDVYLNRWFAKYEDAKESRDGEGGFLLPYRHHFFVCESQYIQDLGLDPEDPDWERIGWDWAKPNDQQAWRRLDQKLRSRAVKARGGS